MFSELASFCIGYYLYLVIPLWVISCVNQIIWPFIWGSRMETISRATCFLKPNFGGISICNLSLNYKFVLGVSFTINLLFIFFFKWPPVSAKRSRVARYIIKSILYSIWVFRNKATFHNGTKTIVLSFVTLLVT